ncbi:hypothetical protein COW98_02775 [Candidatus Roizmanbacteria bacterium CG22_combo_CG10-13_8_21_14_all_35_9]|uniref:Uncharacterized protein n=1 Tax=Candidatus Roizmanbacteria bacterium CG22_combo_CG10-13_8_21_14_all_35_9 TaxID=1974861 RepID=A0A2H0BYI5_9BACT|nr:MAG: hypothetical protein COW98_02775 [Candidatus Roizmanbacteria bacterium CG22_combo_CG10-13_8_21_14_all_35_9]
MESISDDIKFTVLCSHYSDTFANIKESIKLRDKLTALILLVLAFLALYTFWPTDAITAFSGMSEQKLGLAISIDVGFLGSIVWFALLIAVVRYTQVVVYIERQYKYIHKIEEELHKHFDNSIAFTREGKSYLKDYPKFSDWIWTLYTIIFPFVLGVIVLVKIITEWAVSFHAITVPLLLNTTVAVLVLISIILYMFFIHRQK